MSAPADISSLSEHDSLSDSDWLDISSTDRDSDDNDSIYSSRGTDHEDLPPSMSRRSSVSLGSSSNEDVDAWEGLIDDSNGEGMPNDVLAPNHHVPSLSQHPTQTIEPDPVQDASLEELRVKEGLDQSMISTLSSSRSSSLHASTVNNSSRDLRLSFPDPITSSCREPLSTSFEEVQHDSEVVPSPINAGASSMSYEVDDEEMLSASQTFSTDFPYFITPPGPELRVFLYGSSSILKWSVVDRLLQKATRSAGLSVNPIPIDFQGSTHQLIVSGTFEHDHSFPRVITIVDKTLESHDAVNDQTLAKSLGIRPLAVVFLPSGPLHLPEHALLLPVLVPSTHLGKIETESTCDLCNFPEHRLLRITAPEDSPIVDEYSLESIDPIRVYRAFSRLWSGDNNVAKGIMVRTHTLTIIAILSLILGVAVRTTILPIYQNQFITSGHTHDPNSSFWQMLFRPAPYRERLVPSTTIDNSIVVAPPVFKEHSLTVFSSESTSLTLSRVNSADFRRVASSTLSEHLMVTKDLVLQPLHSVLLPDNRPKALSVISEMTPTTRYHPGPVTTGQTVPALMHTSIPSVAKDSTPIAFTVTNKDMQEIFDALDALVQAIHRQTQIILEQAASFVEQSAIQLKNVESFSAESFETMKEALYVHNERARKRAKEIKEMGTKWLYDTSEAIASGAQLSKGVAWEVAEYVAHRAQHARGKAKEMATEIQDFVNEYDRLETLAWDVHAKHWSDWVERVAQGRTGKRCKASRRNFESSIFC